MKSDNSNENTPAILEVKSLEVHFPIKRGVILQRQIGTVRAVDGISFTVNRGETVGLVGESGCGKTTTGLSIQGLVRPTGGSILFDGDDFLSLSRSAQKTFHRRIQMIFQDPYSSLNPRMTIGNAIADPIRVHSLYRGKAVHERVSDMLHMVELDTSLVNRFPHQFSGGQRQRVGIARALSVEPSFIICDEPVSALDVSIQAQILNLLIELQQKLGLTYLFISHDLAVVRHISKRIAVMYLGKIVEFANRDDLYHHPQHPYTQALMAAVHLPNPAVEKQRKHKPLEGTVPNPANPPKGCRFNTRCPWVQEICRQQEPLLREVAPHHFAACHLLTSSSS